MNSKVLVTGCNGQLGNEIKLLLSDAMYTDADTLDITDETAVSSFVKENDIDTIINCAAYTAVDKAEDDVDLAKDINEKGPENLAKTGCKIIHISTDYVFDGSNCRPYTPDDKTNPISVYGKTKLNGENAVAKFAKEYVIIRTAWLYSSFGNNFVKTMRRLGSERETLNVVCDQTGTPTYARDLAEAIVKILPQLNEANSGVYHFSNEGTCSWYDFAVEIMSLSNLNCKVSPILSAEYPTKAVRPFYSVLDKSKLKKTFNISIPHWKESLIKCLKLF